MNSYNTPLRRAAFASCLIAVSQICAQPAANASHAPLGLLRLKDDPKPGDAANLAAAKFAIDDLSPAGVAGAFKGRHRKTRHVLTLD